VIRLVLLFAAATVAALALQTILPLWLPLGFALLPDIVLVLVVDLGLRHHGVVAALMAFVMGYATDAFSGTHIGMNAFLNMVVFLTAYEIARRLMVTNVVIGVITVFLGVLIKEAGAIIINAGLSGIGQIGMMLPAIMLKAAITAAIAPAIFSLLAAVKRLSGLTSNGGRENGRLERVLR
jgi:rod shape-determining protein MreD